MPRLPPTLLRHARHVSPSLAQLLPVCRDLESARNELRWLREHVFAAQLPSDHSSGQPVELRRRLKALVAARAAGRPLQYVLGSQPFGELDILCRSGVLIPRPETESITTHLASLLSSHRPQLRILDLCSGTGCISLLLHSLLSADWRSLHIHGIDVSPAAVALAKRNISHNVTQGFLESKAHDEVSFSQGDVLKVSKDEIDRRPGCDWDVVISNPPYISRRQFAKTTARGVRNWEPRQALVPPLPSPSRTQYPRSETLDQGPAATEADLHFEDGDIFYPRLLDIAAELRAKVVLFEVGDMAQAKRVVRLVVEQRSGWAGCQIWRDSPGQGSQREKESIVIGGKRIEVLGEGNERAVFAWKKMAKHMLGIRI